MKHEFWVNTNLGSVRTWIFSRKKAQHRIIILIGLGEFCEKYARLVSFLYEQACDILIFEWPGLGLSGNFGNPPSTSHIEGFDELVKAGCNVIEEAGWGCSSFYFIGHSMGGHMAFRLTALKKFQVSGIIALSPMMIPKITPSLPIYFIAKIASIIGFKRCLIPQTGQKTLLKTRKFSSNNLLSRNREAIEHIIALINKNPSLARAGVSFGWLSSALHSCYKTTLNPVFLKTIKPPVMILVGSDDKLVSINAIKKTIGFLMNGQLICFNDARHELYIELPKVVEQMESCIIGFITKSCK